MYQGKAADVEYIKLPHKCLSPKKKTMMSLEDMRVRLPLNIIRNISKILMAQWKKENTLEET